MKIGIFTDSHYSDKELSCKTRRPKLSYEKIKEAMQVFADNDAEAVVILGDLLDACVDRSDEPMELEKIGNLINSFGIRVYCLRGNHDCDNFSANDFYRIGNLEPLPFVVKFDNKAMVFLDANFEESQEPYQPREVDWTNSILPNAQIEQLKSVLDFEDLAEAVIFIHQRLDDCEDVRYNVKNSQEIRRILEHSQKVNRVFQGHYHKGDGKVINGIRYITVAAMCEGDRNPYLITEI